MSKVYLLTIKKLFFSLFDLEGHVCDMTSDLESDICNDELINECSVSSEESIDICEDDDETDDTETVDDSSESSKKCYITKLEGEKLSKVHIKKALKLFIPLNLIHEIDLRDTFLLNIFQATRQLTLHMIYRFFQM